MSTNHICAEISPRMALSQYGISSQRADKSYFQRSLHLEIYLGISFTFKRGLSLLSMYVCMYHAIAALGYLNLIIVRGYPSAVIK